MDTNNSTAVEDADFNLSTSNVIFNQQETTREVEILLVKDNFDEVTEQIVLQLRNSVGADIKSGPAVVTIVGTNDGKCLLASHTHPPLQP